MCAALRAPSLPRAGVVPKLKPQYVIRRLMMPIVPFWCITMKHTADHACYGRLACAHATALCALLSRSHRADICTQQPHRYCPRLASLLPYMRSAS